MIRFSQLRDKTMWLNINNLHPLLGNIFTLCPLHGKHDDSPILSASRKTFDDLCFLSASRKKRRPSAFVRFSENNQSVSLFVKSTADDNCWTIMLNNQHQWIQPSKVSPSYIHHEPSLRSRPIPYYSLLLLLSLFSLVVAVFSPPSPSHRDYTPQ